MRRAAPVQHRIAVATGDLAWFEWGAPGPAPSLLLLHATGFHARLWDAVVAALPHDLHILAPDLPGHGRSDAPPQIEGWDTVTAALGPLLDHFGDRTWVAAGHSMGGYCAAVLAGAQPDRIARLVLIDPVILPPDRRASHDAQRPDLDTHPVARRRNRWADWHEMAARFADRTPYATWRRDVLDDYCRWGLTPAADGGFELCCAPRFEASVYAASLDNDVDALVAAVACPALVLRAGRSERDGPMDFAASPTWPGLAAALADGRDRVWSDCTHFMPMEQPDRLAALIAGDYALAKQG